MRWAVIVLGLAALGLGGCPEMAINPGSGPQGAQGYRIDLTGTYTNWLQGTTVAEFLTPSGITVQELVVGGRTSAYVIIDIPTGEATGDYTLQLTTGDEVVEATFRVTEAPRITLHPPSAERYASGQTVLVEGVGTTFTAPGFAVAVHIPGVTVVGAPNVFDDTHALVTLDVDMSPEEKVYQKAFVVHTDWQDVALDFEITPVQGRYIELDPVSSDTGEVVEMTITGHKTFFDDPGLPWEGMFEFDLWDGIEVVDHKVVSATELYVELWVHTLAPAGMRTITVTDTWGPLDATFLVVRDTTSPVVTFDPPSALPRADPLVVATGTNTSFSDGASGSPATTVEVSPTGHGFAMVIQEVVDASTILLRTVIDIDVSPLDYEITFHTGPEHVTGTFAVDELPDATIMLSHTVGQQMMVIPDFVITGTNTHFEGGGVTVPEVAGGGGVTLSNFVVESEILATATLTIAATAATGQHIITLRTDAWNEAPSATFTVEAGTPVVTLSPQTVNQGDEDVTIGAAGHFTGWDSTTDVAPLDCGLDITMGPVTGPGALTFDVSVPLFHIPKVCTLEFTGSGQPTVSATLLIQSTAIDPGDLPWDDGYFLDGPDRFTIELDQGDVIKARARREIWSSIDLVLGIYGSGTSLADPLIENDDESAATVDSLVVFQAPETGMYFLYVRERWSDSFTGDYRLQVDYHTPTSLKEMPTITDPDSNGTDLQATLLGPAEASWHIRGQFQTATPADTSDFYRIAGATGVPLALQIVARDVSPADISTAEVSLVLYGDSAADVITPVFYSHEGVDPMAYVTLPGAFNDLLIEVVRAPGCPVNTTYWLNVRPALVINEVMFDHANGFYGSFVELYGEPFASLAGCELVLVDDGVSAPPIPLEFGDPPEPYVLTDYGYQVVGHDTGVPGVDDEQVKAELAFSASGADQAVQLWCDTALVDAVQYRGSPGGGGEGAPATEPPSGKSIGRGFHADSDDNASDFLEQIEPSPWMRNLTEVR